MQIVGILGRGVEEHADAGARRQGLFQKLQILPIDGRAGHHRHPRDGATRMREALDESRGHRLFGHQHDDRALGHRLLHRLGDEVGGHHKDIDGAGGEVGDERGHAIELALYVSTLNRDCLALDVAQLTQTLREYLEGLRVCAAALCVRNPIVGTFPAGCAPATSGAASRLSVSMTMTPTVRHHIICPSLVPSGGGGRREGGPS